MFQRSVCILKCRTSADTDWNVHSAAWKDVQSEGESALTPCWSRAALHSAKAQRRPFKLCPSQTVESAAGSVLAFLLSALNEQLSESSTNESPLLSVLMNFNTDTKITYLLLLQSW